MIANGVSAVNAFKLSASVFARDEYKIAERIG